MIPCVCRYLALVPLIGAPHFLHDVTLNGLTQFSVPHRPHLIFSSATVRLHVHRFRQVFAPTGRRTGSLIGDHAVRGALLCSELGILGFGQRAVFGRSGEIQTFSAESDARDR